VLFLWIAVVGFWLSRVNLSLVNAGLRERPQQ
jgi:hypothetical protein